MTPASELDSTFEGAVRVPASTSNLGPGFDQLGLALELFLEVRCRALGPGEAHRFGSLEGTAHGWCIEGNWLPRAFDAARHRAGAGALSLIFEVSSEIPVCRGLGSSGAAIAAGLALANQSLGDRSLSPDKLAALGNELEGHPDNSTASLFGGCTLGIPIDGGELKTLHHDVHESLRFAVAWGPSPMPTERARAVLPKQLATDDVIWHLQRLSLLLRGLQSGDRECLMEGVVDRLHTPFRLPLIPGGAEALAAARTAGAWACAISGSGSALVAIHSDAQRAQVIADAMCDALAKAQGSAQSRVLGVARKGALARK